MLRLVLFGSGSPLSTGVLDALVERFSVVAVVVPAVGRGRTLRAKVRSLVGASRARPLVRAARRLGIQALRMRPGEESTLATRLAPSSPDLICVASFPLLLRSPVLTLPRLGAVGVHPSLLPRHRGGWPLFWTYFHDDRDCGITVHWLDDGPDTGAIIRQASIPLPRGEPVTQLYRELVRRGALLLVEAVEAIERGTAPRIPQDDARATVGPNPARGSWRRDVMAWDAERLWHFLHGLGRLHGELLTDMRGRPVPHGPATRFSLEAHDRRPGMLERRNSGWRVYCRDGVVDTARPALRATLRRVARKLR